MHIHMAKNVRDIIYLDFRKISLDLVKKKIRDTLAAGWTGNSGQLGPNSAMK